MNKALWSHLALFAAALIYGANYIIAKSVMPDPLNASSFIVLRVLGACLLFWLFAFRKMVIPRKEHWGRLFICAVTGVAVNQLLFFNGLSITSPVNASIIMTSNPILVMMISAVALKQKITLIKIFGVLSGATGAVSLLWLSSYDASGLSTLRGDLYILINSVSWACYLVLVKPLLREYHPLTITAWVFLIGIFLVTPFGGTGLYSVNWSVLSNWQWFSVFYVIVGTTFLAYLFNMIGVHHLSPTVASSYIYFQPILAGLFAFVFSILLKTDFTGDITWPKVVCAILIFGGVYLVSKSDEVYSE